MDVLNRGSDLLTEDLLSGVEDLLTRGSQLFTKDLLSGDGDELIEDF